jgi:hypothetical protein
MAVINKLCMRLLQLCQCVAWKSIVYIGNRLQQGTVHAYREGARAQPRATDTDNQQLVRHDTNKGGAATRHELCAACARAPRGRDPSRSCSARRCLGSFTILAHRDAETETYTTYVRSMTPKTGQRIQSQKRQANVSSGKSNPRTHHASK